MKKNQKVLLLLIVLLLLALLCSKILTFESITYKLDVNGTRIKIKEVLDDDYYIEIKANKKTYPFRIYENLNKKRKIVKKVYMYKDKNIECILPIIGDNVYSDMMCYKDDILYDYHQLTEENKELDKYVNSIKPYNKQNFIDEITDITQIGTVKFNNIDHINHIIAITTYKGLIINNSEINLFKKDIYNNKLSLFTKGYYLVADYENDYSFNYFYLVNLETKEVSKIKSKIDISYDSYIQGVVDDKIYLYDIDNETQYEIDINNSDISIVSNDNYIRFYSNKKWEKMNKAKANKKVYFNYDTLDNNFTRYDYVKEVKDYFYLFKKEGIYYKLYRVDKSNINVYKFIATVPVTNINFNDNYLYYLYKSKLFFYSDSTGLKTVLENSEFKFNNTIKYYIY